VLGYLLIMDAFPMPDEPAPTPLRLTTGELRRRLDGFVDDYLADKSPQTAGTYRRSLNTFERWYAVHKQRFRFTEDGVRAYKTYLMEDRGLHQVSVSTYLTALRRFCQYLVDIGELESNPATEVKGNRRPSTHSRQVLTEQDIEVLFSAIDVDSTIGKRDVAMMYLMVYGGLSEIELVRADLEDLEQTLMGWFLRVQGKGHTAKDQQVPVDDRVLEKIRLYLDARGRYKPKDPLFVSHGNRSEGKRLNTRSVRSRINGHLKAAGVKRRGVTPHSLTHTAPLIWLNEGKPIEEVKERMRHGTLETTMIYYKKQGLLKRDPEEVQDAAGD